MSNIRRHEPDARGWRVLVLQYQEWRRRWTWRSAFLIRCTDAFAAIARYICQREMVRLGLASAVRLVAPDGTIAAEEYASFRSEESERGDRLIKRRVWWPKSWDVRDGARCGLVPVVPMRRRFKQ